MIPLVSSILGFPEEKGNACVKVDKEVEEEEQGDSLGWPGTTIEGGRITSSGDAPPITVLELVDMFVQLALSVRSVKSLTSREMGLAFVGGPPQINDNKAMSFYVLGKKLSLDEALSIYN